MIELMYDLLELATDDSAVMMIDNSSQLPKSIKNLLLEYNRLYKSGINDYTKMEDEEGIKKDLKFCLSKPNILKKTKDWYDLFLFQMEETQVEDIKDKFSNKKVAEYFINGGADFVKLFFSADEISDNDLEIMGLTRDDFLEKDEFEDTEDRIR